jgi:hypothetical protein
MIKIISNTEVNFVGNSSFKIALISLWNSEKRRRSVKYS